MNRPNGSSFQARGPLPGRGRVMPPGGRLPPQPYPPNGGRGGPPFPGRLPQGRGVVGRPPMMGGPVAPPRMQQQGRGPAGGRHFAPHRGGPPPPSVMGGRPPPPGVPHGGPQMNRRPPNGHLPQHMHQQPNQRQPFHGRGGPMNPGMGRGPPPNPQSLMNQHPPYPPGMNGGMPPLPMNNSQIPPPPPHQLQSSFLQPPNVHLQNYNNTQQGPPPPGQVAGRHGMQVVPPPSAPPVHDPRLRAPLGPPKNGHHQQQQHPPIAATAAPPHQPSQHHLANTSNASQYSKEQIDQAWTEYTAPNGMKYYHNNLLQTSTYDVPEVLKAKEVNSTPKTVERPWTQYTCSQTGKFYYSNGITTTWEKPEGFRLPEEIEQSEDPQPPKKKKKTAKKEIEFSCKEEAIATFKGLLLAKEISPTTKWNDVSKTCSSDPKWEACEEALTTGERKQALAEYQTKRANDIRASERQEKIRTGESFMQLLTEKLSEVKGFSAWTSRFDSVRASLSKDDRFHAVANEATRESLFLDFCEEYKKREERKKRSKKRETQDAFISFLKEREELGKLSHASTWNTFLSSLDEKDLKDPRFQVSSHMSDSDRQLYFADYVILLQKADDDKRDRIRASRHRAEKAQREAFIDALNELANNGKIMPASRWRTVEPQILSLPSYGPVFDQGRETPRDIFEEFVADWSESFRRDRAFLSQLVYPANGKQIVVTPNTTYDEFNKALLDAADDSPDLYRQTRRIIGRTDPVSSAKLYYNELVLDAKGANGAAFLRRGSAARRRGEDSSEDEGEIVEEGEIEG